MTEKQVHLAIDLGASSGRVIAGVVSDQSIGGHSAGGPRLTLETVHRFENEAVRIQDSLQWDVVGLWREILTGLRMAHDRFGEVASVGVDTWGVDYVLLDKQDQQAGPVRCYRDPRNRGMLERAFQIVPREEIFQSTGLQFMEINTLYQLIAARLGEDVSLEVADGFLMMGDFFHWLLTGRRSVEVTNASTTQLLDPRTKRWCEDLMQRFGLPRRLFGDPVEPGTTLGIVQPSVAAQTGLDNVPVVIPATHDTASAVLAVPADDFAPAAPSWCYISSGTWSLMGCELPEPKINATCSELNFTNEGGVQGSTRLLKNIGGLWVFQQIRKAMQRRGRDVSWEEMVNAARQATPFALLVNPDDPTLVAPDDMVDAIHAIAERTGQRLPDHDGAEHDGILYRASLEGLALRYRACLQMLETLTENRIDTIHIVGGGSQNQLLCQMTADACERTVVAGPVEATAIGNVLMQRMGTGELSSVQEARKLVRSSFETTTYQPVDPGAWTEPAEKFAQL
jgi:rhamnulokinase